MASKKSQAAAKKRSLEITTGINAPVEAVWKALTNAEELKRWFPLDASVKPGVGGMIRLEWGEHVWELNIQELIENRYIKLTYDQEHHIEEQGAPRNTNMVREKDGLLSIEYFLEGDQGKTLLRIVHHGFSNSSSWDDMYDGVRRGWLTESRSLKYYLEHHPGKDRQVALSAITIQQPFEEVWNIMMKQKGQLHLQPGNKDNTNETSPQYAYTTPLGTTYSGEVLFHNPPLDLSGSIRELNNALLMLKIEQFCAGKEAMLWVWIGGYDLDAATMSNLKKSWDEKLQELFGQVSVADKSNSQNS